MPIFSSPSEEARHLADALFDGRLDHFGFQRLETLIVSNLSCLQVYVERANFHSELLELADEQSPEDAALAVLKEFSRVCSARERRRSYRDLLLVVTTACLVFGLITWGYFVTDGGKTSPVGRIASLSTNASTGSADLELGRFVRWRETLSVSTGIVSLQLPNVLVDVVGPAKVRLTGERELSLMSGTLMANVQPGGEGFKIQTPDAEVVDLGTEFLVSYEPQRGTDVSVRRGRAQVKLIDRQSHPAMFLELTDNRSAHVEQSKALVREIDFQSESFLAVDQSRGGIRSIDGNLRTAIHPPVSLQSEQTTTPNHMLVIPERQNVVLDEDLVVVGIEGPVRIPAGSCVSSYLIHYDPTELVTFAPRGGVTFFGQIAAVIVNSDALQGTDGPFGLEATLFEEAGFRELELDEDEIRISNDRKTVSFFFGANPNELLDEARILVVSESR